jgi:hypothetical protein
LPRPGSGPTTIGLIGLFEVPGAFPSALSPDGRWVATRGFTANSFVGNVETGEVVLNMGDCVDFAWPAFSPDSRRVWSMHKPRTRFGFGKGKSSLMAWDLDAVPYDSEKNRSPSVCFPMPFEGLYSNANPAMVVLESGVVLCVDEHMAVNCVNLLTGKLLWRTRPRVVYTGTMRDQHPAVAIAPLAPAALYGRLDRFEVIHLMESERTWFFGRRPKWLMRSQKVHSGWVNHAAITPDGT